MVEATSVLTKKLHDGIISSHGYEIRKGVDASITSIFAQSLVQDDWFQIIKGEIPVSIKNNSKTRKERYENAVQKSEKEHIVEETIEYEEPVKVKKARSSNKRIIETLRVSDSTSSLHFKGQAAAVLSALEALGSGTRQQIREICQSAPEFKGAPEATVKNNVNVYIFNLKKSGAVEVVK
jgi:hypothetical protein